MESKLLEEVKNLAKRELEKNERFHDWGHAKSVFENAKIIIKGERADKKVNVLAVLTATLLHDISNAEKNDSLESAKLVPGLLNSVLDFPKDLIPEVQRLVASVESGMLNESNLDEVIVNEADELEALSKLSICRAFMMYGAKKEKVKDSIDNFVKYIEKKEKQFASPDHTKTAKKLFKQRIKFIKNFLLDCQKIYN